MAGQEHTDIPAAWLIRAGRHGEREDFNIGHGIASMGWDDLPDLAGTSRREDMTAMIRTAMPDASESRIAAYAGQLWTVRARVRPGHLVVLPRKKTSQIALGIVTREYRYRNDLDPQTAPRGVGGMEAHRRAPHSRQTRPAVLAWIGPDRVFHTAQRQSMAPPPAPSDEP